MVRFSQEHICSLAHIEILFVSTTGNRTLPNLRLTQETGPVQVGSFGMIMNRKRDHAVKRSKFTEEQIAFALKQPDVGAPAEEVCRKMGMSDATFCSSTKKTGGLSPSEAQLLKQLEKENATRALLREQDWSRANSVKHLLPAHFPFELCD